jgi:hypothetical protein
MAKRGIDKSTDRAGQICRALRHAIIEQALEPGAKLPEDAIGERFGASRTIVRHALRSGEAAPQPWRRGRHSELDEARDIFDERFGLERAGRHRRARLPRPGRRYCRAGPTARRHQARPLELHPSRADTTFAEIVD